MVDHDRRADPRGRHHGPPARRGQRATSWPRRGWASSRPSRRRSRSSLALLPLWTLVGDWIFWVNGVTMTIAVVLTVASGIDYVVTEVRGARQRAERAGMTDAAHDAASALLAGLAARGWTVAVAESLTGGLVLATLVSMPGASASLRGGVVAYATDLKHSLLGVDAGPARCGRTGAPGGRGPDGRGRSRAGRARRRGRRCRHRDDRRRRPGLRRTAARSAPCTSPWRPRRERAWQALALAGTRAEIRAEATRRALRDRARPRRSEIARTDREQRVFRLGYIRRFPPIPQRAGLDWPHPVLYCCPPG